MIEYVWCHFFKLIFVLISKENIYQMASNVLSFTKHRTINILSKRWMRKNPNSFRLIHLRMQRISSVSHKSCKFTCFDKAFHIFFLPLHKSLFFFVSFLFLSNKSRARTIKKNLVWPMNGQFYSVCTIVYLSFCLFACLFVRRSLWVSR